MPQQIPEKQIYLYAYREPIALRLMAHDSRFTTTKPNAEFRYSMVAFFYIDTNRGDITRLLTMPKKNGETAEIVKFGNEMKSGKELAKIQNKPFIERIE